MAVLVPHFDLPFRLSGTSFAVVEQDSEPDIENCVEAIIRTPLGTRDDNSDFGLEDSILELMPLNTAAMTEQIQTQEPRATAQIVQTVNADLSADLTVTVNK